MAQKKNEKKINYHQPPTQKIYRVVADSDMINIWVSNNICPRIKIFSIVFILIISIVFGFLRLSMGWEINPYIIDAIAN